MTENAEKNLYIQDAKFYDLDNRPATKIDIPFYIDFASRIEGAILELACGTGRITIPLAAAGHEIWGLELSDTMIEQFNNKIKKLPPDTSGRIHLLKGSMGDFKLERKFPLVLLPARSFQLLYEEKYENACLQCVYNHLTGNGYFIIDIGDFVGDKGINWVNEEEVFDWENVDPASGYKIRRTHIKKEIDTKGQIIYPQKNFYITKDDVLVEKVVKRSPWKYFSADQVRKLLTNNGFKIVEEMGSYDGTPINQGTEFIFICRKK